MGLTFKERKVMAANDPLTKIAGGQRFEAETKNGKIVVAVGGSEAYTIGVAFLADPQKPRTWRYPTVEELQQTINHVCRGASFVREFVLPMHIGPSRRPAAASAIVLTENVHKSREFALENARVRWEDSNGS